jgi:NAD(P)-dependent dehydrogenase (short-subunit alcohol dehydrogenase family)
MGKEGSIPMTIRFDDRVAIVTGAGAGLGRQHALLLGSRGAKVVVNDPGGAVDGKGTANAVADQVVAEIKAAGGEAVANYNSVADAKSAQGIIDTAMQTWGRLDILVNNAGIAALGRDGAPSTADIEAVRSTIETNFIGALAVTQAMLPLLRKSKSASIVNVSSELGSITGHTTPEWKFAHVRAIGYSASKAAMNMMTAQLALELAGTAIKVNSVNPGYTATDLNKHSGPQTVQEGAAETIRLALAGPDGPTGGFYETGGTLPW